jgi:hypothetical protein
MLNLKDRVFKVLNNDKVKNVVTTVAAVAAMVVIYGIALEVAKAQMDYVFEKAIDLVESTNGKGFPTAK